MTKYPSIVEQIIALNPLPELSPSRGPSPETRRLLQGIKVEYLFLSPIVSHVAAYACLAGLWLHVDGLDEAHQIVQQEPDELLAALNLHSQSADARHLREMTTTFAYWHGIMHRREPDYGNAKYWFRRVPRHPVFETLAVAARQLAAQSEVDRATEFLQRSSTWDAMGFVDLCQQIAQGKSSSEDLARKVALREWELLFEHCYGRAIA